MWDIAVYDKDPVSLKFLRDFFLNHPVYNARFISSLKTARTQYRKNLPDVIVAGSPCCLDKNVLLPGIPVIAMVSNQTEGMTHVIKHGIEFYLLRPYFQDDLEYKLEVITRKKSYLDAIRQDKKHLEALLELTHLVSSSLDPKEILYFIVNKLSEIIPVTRCSMLSIEGGGKYARVVSTYENPAINDLKLELKKYPEIVTALRTKNTVVIKDAMKDPLMKRVRLLIKPLGIKSIVVIPVVLRNEVVGTLFLRTSSKEHQFTDKELNLCKNLADASASALNNAFLFGQIKEERERLEKLSITDFLTGLYNVRYLYHRLDGEFSRALRYHAPLGCIMLDIDHFKKINDNYGHRTGDMVLKEFSEIIKKYIRKSDVLARYGGEEFIILLPHTSLKGAVSEAKRLRNVLNKHRFKNLKSNQRLTISQGISSIPNKKVKTPEDLIRFADDALLRAKEKGRDTFVVYE